MKENMISILLSILMIYAEISLVNAQEDIDISSIRLAENVRILSSDFFEGRAPSTSGEAKTISFLKEKLQEMGLKPGNGDSYFQNVDLVKITAHAGNVTIGSNIGLETMVSKSDIAITTKQTKDSVDLSNSEIVFVGYGAVAPEYGWNDYQDIDVKGKTVLILDQDPGFLSGNVDQFQGKGVTYYARASYKYEEAVRQGAKAAFIIHDEDFTSASWEQMEGIITRSALSLDPAKIPAVNLEIQGRIPKRTVEKLFRMAGHDYTSEKDNALKKGYNGVSLGVTISVHLDVDVKYSKSNNVIGIIPGSKRPDEFVFYMAHWDHLGTDASLEGDQIYNGARDNASGTAGLLEIANAHMKAGAPERSIAFLWVTAEESGLLGSYYYVLNPIYPLNKTVTAINTDTMNIYARTKDVWVLGLGDSEMDDFIRRSVGDKQGKRVTFFPHPEWGIEYRGDHFSFNRVGIPSIVVSGGYDPVDQNIDMEALIDAYDANGYHKVTDEFSEEMDFNAATDDLKSMFLIGTDIANSTVFPNWYAGKEFKYLRDKHMREIGYQP